MEPSVETLWDVARIREEFPVLSQTVNGRPLVYLASRGLHPELARNLLTYGFTEELVEKIKIESIRRQLDEAILNRLHARLEA